MPTTGNNGAKKQSWQWNWTKKLWIKALYQPDQLKSNKSDLIKKVSDFLVTINLDYENDDNLPSSEFLCHS